MPTTHSTISEISEWAHYADILGPLVKEKCQDGILKVLSFVSPNPNQGICCC
jgi:hypothetical protein